MTSFLNISGGLFFAFYICVCGLYMACQCRLEKYCSSSFVKNVPHFPLFQLMQSVWHLTKSAILNDCKIKLFPGYFSAEPSYVQCEGFSWPDWRCLDMSLASRYLQFGHRCANCSENCATFSCLILHTKCLKIFHEKCSSLVRSHVEEKRGQLHLADDCRR